MVAAPQKVIEFALALEQLPHAIFLRASLHLLASLPAFPPCNFIGFHFKSIFFHASENVQAPIIPHGGSCLDNVVRLGVQLGEAFNRVVVFLIGTVSFEILLLIF